MNVIEFKNVWKKFRKGEKLNSLRDAIPHFFKKSLTPNNNGELKDKEFWALKDVSFGVKNGEVVGIIGPNGAGKSTALKLLSGILKPNKGEVSINGRLSALIEVTAGFHPDLTGRENIYLNGTILGMKRREIDSKFDEIVEFSGVEEFIDTPVKRYSSGMYSRLGFSVAAHMEPDILLVDEVLSVGDIAFQEKCAQKMRELLSLNTTIILVSHNLALIQGLCKTVVLLNRGEILKTGPTDEIIPYYQDLANKEKAEEAKKRVRGSDYKLKLKEGAKVDISKISFYGSTHVNKEDFNVGEGIYIRAEINSKEIIANPIFLLELMRTDGVISCFAHTPRSSHPEVLREGKNLIQIYLEKPMLTPNVYLAKLSIWDRDFLHSYAVRKEDTFRVKSADFFNPSDNAVFYLDTTWELNKNE